mmetsp:Transcript_97387/g.314491  ORF Transcript_97387/g.314491 Transcript_97387/m.314491 type:complete len:281 (+) Transcript_97387:233-1075(+)
MPSAACCSNLRLTVIPGLAQPEFVAGRVPGKRRLLLARRRCLCLCLRLLVPLLRAAAAVERVHPHQRAMHRVLGPLRQDPGRGALRTHDHEAQGGSAQAPVRLGCAALAHGPHRLHTTVRDVHTLHLAIPAEVCAQEVWGREAQLVDAPDDENSPRVLDLQRLQLRLHGVSSRRATAAELREAVGVSSYVQAGPVPRLLGSRLPGPCATGKALLVAVGHLLCSSAGPTTAAQDRHFARKELPPGPSLTLHPQPRVRLAGASRKLLCLRPLLHVDGPVLRR